MRTMKSGIRDDQSQSFGLAVFLRGAEIAQLPSLARHRQRSPATSKQEALRYEVISALRGAGTINFGDIVRQMPPGVAAYDVYKMTRKLATEGVLEEAGSGFRFVGKEAPQAPAMTGTAALPASPVRCCRP